MLSWGFGSRDGPPCSLGIIFPTLDAMIASWHLLQEEDKQPFFFPYKKMNIMLSSLFPDENRQVLEELVLDICFSLRTVGMSPHFWPLLCQHGQSLLQLHGNSRHSLSLCALWPGVTKSVQGHGRKHFSSGTGSSATATSGRSPSLHSTMGR